MKKKILILSAAACAAFPAWSQSIGPSTLNASGKSAVIAGNTYEYAIGDLLVPTFQSASLVVTQGVLQPQVKPNGINDPDFFAGSFSIFPNPAEEQLFLQPSFASGGTLSCQLYDALGRVVLQSTFELATGKEKQSIVLKDLAASTYVLNVSFRQKGKTYGTSYKVQKLQ